MNFKLNGLVTAMVVAVGMTTFVGTASAQGIPGTFFAIDGVEAFLDEDGNVSGNTETGNTETQVDRETVGSTFIGTRFSSTRPNGGTEFPNGFLNFWEEREWILTDNGTELTRLGFTGIVFPPNPATPQEDTDPAIVTTLTGLAAGEYEVNFIFAGALRTPDAARLQYLHGFSPTDTSQIATSTADNLLAGVDLDVPSDINGTLQVFSSLIGNTSVGADGELRVYTELDPNATPSAPNFSAFLGLSIVPVPVNCLVGDVNLSGTVSFDDIPPFIAVLQAGVFQCEADTDENGVVNFSDIPGFITILSSQ